MQLFKTALLAVLLVTATACAQTATSDVSAQPPPAFENPDGTAEENSSVLAKYDHLDPNRVVPDKALKDAVLYFDKNKSKIKNQNYISVIDFSKNSRENRFHIINMSTGAVWSIKTAHGKNSDPDYDGYATSFSNTNGTNKSSLGYYLTAETYYGEHGLSLRLDGLSSTNSNARSRAIVIHGASYVNQNSSSVSGRSWGCPAVDMTLRDRVISTLKNGSLIYAVYK